MQTVTPTSSAHGLLGRAAAHFSKRSRLLGREYYVAGRVGSLRTSAVDAHAVVRGTRAYTVGVRVSAPSELTCACTCPRFVEHQQNCKHVWALLEASAAAGALGTLAASGPVGLEVDDVPQGAAGALAPRARIPSWRGVLESIARDAAPNRARRADGYPRELAYVVEPAETIACGRLVLELVDRAVSPKGTPYPWKPVRHLEHRTAAITNERDRQIVSILTGARRYDASGFGYDDDVYDYRYGRSDGTRFALSKALWELVLPLAGATERFFYRKRGHALAPLAWDDGGAWRFKARAVLVEGGLEVRGALARGDREIPVGAPALLVAGGLVFHEGRVALLDDAGAYSWIGALRRAPFLVPHDEVDAFLDELAGSPIGAVIELPDALRLPEERITPRIYVVIRAPESKPWYMSPPLVVSATARYDEHDVALGAPGDRLRDSARRRTILRDLPAERAALAVLEEVGVKRAPNGEALRISASYVARAVPDLLAAGFHVEAEGKIYRSPHAVALRVSTGIDWFGLEGAVDFEGVPLAMPALLRAIKRGERLVALGDGSIGMLPEEWLRQWRVVADVAETRDERVTFRRSQVGLLDALLTSQPGAISDEAFGKLRARIGEGVRAGSPGRTFRGKLRAYQKVGLGWLRMLEECGFGGCLADDMGLGKTVQVLAHLASREKGGPSLIVAPRSLVWNWREQAGRFAPKLKVLDHIGAARLPPGEHFGAYDVVLTTYGTMRQDVAALHAVDFDYVILDEAQAVKNARAAASKAARALKAKHRLALSGTPIENHLGELWALFEFLNPGMLGAASAFQGTMTGRDVPAETRALLARALRPFVLRRVKAEVAPELPARVEETIRVSLEPAQQKLYDELREHYRASLLGRLPDLGKRDSTTHILAALLRLRQAACHPGLLDSARAGDASAKLDALLERLDEVLAQGHKALVFSQFTSLLAIVKARLDARGVVHEVLDGATHDRRERVERFQTDPKCPVFLISLKAGGVGLNLTAAEYVFLLDPWWNPAVEAQAIDRAHRIGQERTVFAYRIIASGTVEEKVLELQQSKRALADAILGESGSGVMRDLRPEDLELLLS